MPIDDHQDITVLGAGSYGTALAVVLAGNGQRTLLWGHDPLRMQTLARAHCNQQYLPGVDFPNNLTVTADLQQAVQTSKNLLVVVPSHAFATLLTQIKPYLQADTLLIWATKGLEYRTGRLLYDVAREQLGPRIPLAVLSGPTFAREMAIGLPTAISLAGTNADRVQIFAKMLHNDSCLRVYTNDDLTGMQLGGVVKNVIAIAAGISDGLGFGANARTALITRGLMEMQRLGVVMGAKPETFMGMAGLGDLVLTCTDNQSRNRRFGIAIGQGQAIDASLKALGQVVEGYTNTTELKVLATQMRVEMPICEQVYQVLYGHTPAKQAALHLLGRSRKAEI